MLKSKNQVTLFVTTVTLASMTFVLHRIIRICPFTLPICPDSPSAVRSDCRYKQSPWKLQIFSIYTLEKSKIKIKICSEPVASWGQENTHRISTMEVDDGESGEGPCSFWVVRVPQAVFSTDPEETLRVRCCQYHTHTHTHTHTRWSVIL